MDVDKIKIIKFFFYFIKYNIINNIYIIIYDNIKLK